MSIYSAGTDIGNAGTVKGSGANLTSIPGTVFGGYNVVGCHALLYNYSGTVPSGGGTKSGSTMRYTNVEGDGNTGTPSGTWRLMGHCSGNSHQRKATSVWHRIS